MHYSKPIANLILILLVGLINGQTPIAPDREKNSNQDEIRIQNLKSLSAGTINAKEADTTKPAVVLFFDDGFYAFYQYAYPLLKRHKMTASLGLIASYIKNYKLKNNRTLNSFMTQNEVQELIDSLAVEIASHSVSHTRLIEIQDTMLIKYELVVSKKILESLFDQKVITFVYPYGKYDDQIVRMTSEAGYLIGRTCDFGEPNFWIAPFKVPIKEVRDTMSVKHISDYIKKHDQTVLVFHKIVPKPKVFTEYSVSRFDSILSILELLKVRIYTMRELYGNWRQEVLRKIILERGLLSSDNWDSLLFQQVDIDLTRTRP